nr:hypothetical protein [Halomonas elongata]
MAGEPETRRANDAGRPTQGARGMLRFLGLVVLGALIGGLAALAAVGFVSAVLWLNDLLLISPRGRMMFAHPRRLPSPPCWCPASAAWWWDNCTAPSASVVPIPLPT